MSAPRRDVRPRLEAALAARAPHVLTRLRKGASVTAVLRLLQTTVKAASLGLPASFCALMRWHDGAHDDVRPFDGLVWLGVKDILAHKKMMDDIIESGHYAAFQADEWWSTGWVPFADDQGGYGALVIDLHGSFDGTPGQVMRVAAKDSTRVILAPSFEAWLATYTEILERGYLEQDTDDPPGRALSFDRRATALFARRKGFPRFCEPRPVEHEGEAAGADLTRPTRGARPAKIPAGARWLVSASGASVEHCFIDHDDTRVTTWTGDDLTRLHRTVVRRKDAAVAAAYHDEQLRKQLYRGFVLGGAAGVQRGDPVCALHVGDGANAECIDLSPDGRTLAVGTILDGARGANLHLIDVVTGRRRHLHAETVGDGHPQTFIHRVAFGPDGRDLYYQLNTELRVVPVAGGAPRVLATMKEPPQNPHVSQFEFDRTRERLLYFDGPRVCVRRTDRKRALLKIPGPKAPCEYREATISPSGKLVAVVHQSRGVIYGHDDAKHDTTDEIQIWSVDRGEQIASLPRGGSMLRGISFSADDKTLIVGDYSEIVARDVRGGARVWQRAARAWAYAPDGAKLAVAARSTGAQVLDARTRRVAFGVHERRPWATEYGEIHDIMALQWSADGELLVEGNSGGRVYVWAMT